MVAGAEIERFCAPIFNRSKRCYRIAFGVKTTGGRSFECGCRILLNSKRVIRIHTMRVIKLNGDSSSFWNRNIHSQSGCGIGGVAGAPDGFPIVCKSCLLSPSVASKGIGGRGRVLRNRPSVITSADEGTVIIVARKQKINALLSRRFIVRCFILNSPSV